MSVLDWNYRNYLYNARTRARSDKNTERFVYLGELCRSSNDLVRPKALHTW